MFAKKTTLGILMMGLATATAATAQIEPGGFARDNAKEYRELARYPESSRALKAGEADPIKAKRTATRQTRRGPDGAEPWLSVWTAKISYEVGQPVDLFATLEERNKAVRPDGIDAEIADASGAVVTLVSYKDDGRGADVKAGDGVWSARLTMPKGLEPAPAASYMVRVKARLADGDLREAAGGFLWSQPAAHLTGKYRDFLRDGSLVVAAEVEVTEEGRFHLSGTLHTLGGEPIGTAQAGTVLEPGRHWIELSYYGLMFHDRKAAGPYRLGTLSLATTTTMPNALNDLVENAHVTRAYALDRMTERPFQEPRLLETAKRLELDAERAQREAAGPERQ